MDQSLSGDVVLIEVKLLGTHPVGNQPGARREPPKFRHEHFDYEASAWLQVGGYIAEAGYLRFLGGEVGDGIEDEVGKIKGLAHFGGGKVTGGDVDGLSPWFSPHLIEHLR